MMQKIATCAILSAALALSVVPAAAGNSREVSLPHEATLNGTALPAGMYVIAWKSHSPEITVTFKNYRNGSVVATAPGKMIERERRYEQDAVVYKVNPDGSRRLAELQFAGSKKAIVFEPGA